MPSELSEPDAQRLRQVRTLTRLMDESIPIPFTKKRIGLDGLLGLIPGIGDAAGTLVSAFLIAQSARLGAPPATLVRMALNVGLEAVVGLVPILGDLFDFAFKAPS